MSLLDDLLVQTAVFPLIIGIAAVGLSRAVGGRRLAAAGIGLAFLAAFAVIVGLPGFPPPSSLGRLFWGAALGVAAGIAADLAGFDRRRTALVIGAWLAAALGWLAWPVLPGGLETVTRAVLLVAAAWLLLARAAEHDDGAAAPGILLLAGSLAVGGVAMAGASASIGQLAFALAAATGGMLLWNWPVQRHGWGAAGQAALGILVLLAAALTFFSSAHTEALLALLPAVYADRLRDRLPLPATAVGRAAGTAALGVIALLPALAAIGLAFLLSAGAEASGY